jgi:small conductance mechanosensitive channel
MALDFTAPLPVIGITLFQVLLAIVILIAGWIIARIIVMLFRRGMERSSRLPPLVIEFLTRFLSALLIVAVLLLAVSALGIAVGSVVLGLSAVIGLVLGFGMQDSINNFAAGVWVAALRPLDINEVISVNGMTGRVSAVGIMATELLTPDNTYITLPNSTVWGSPIINYTRMDTRRVDVPVGISYGSNADDAFMVAMNLMKDHPLVLADPEPAVVMTELADSSVNLQLRAWTNTGDYWTVKGDLTKGILERLTAEGIEIPFPQLDVHIEK